MKKIIKNIYKIIPFKKEIFSAVKKIWKPEKSVYQHLHFNGTIKVDVNETKSFKIKHYGYQVENELFWAGIDGGFEKESIKLWIKLCSKANTIVDIGANTGVYSLIAKALKPEATVYALEPVKRVFDKLIENVHLNNYDIISIEKAASNFNGTATIYDVDSEHTYSVTVNKNFFPKDQKVIETQIETITMDSFIEEYKIENIDLIKIDVETHEPEVLEGYKKYLAIHKPTMLVEILSKEIGAQVTALVDGLGYLYFNIDERGGIRQESQINKSDYFNYLLCNEEVAKELGLIA